MDEHDGIPGQRRHSGHEEWPEGGHTPDFESVRTVILGHLDLATRAMAGEAFDRALAEHDREVAAKTLREFGTALDSVPDYRASAYDEGRVDQRHDDAVAALVRADSIERGV